MNTIDSPPVIAHSVRFTLNRWDVLRCRLWVAVHNPKLVAIILIMCIAVPAVTYHTPEGTGFSLLYCAFYFLIMTTLMLVVNVVFQILFQAVWVCANKNRGVIGDHELIIRAEGLVERTPFNDSLHRWAGFHKVAASRNYLFVFVTDNIVHYIPFRVFATNEDAMSFRAELQRRANAA